MPSDLSTLLDIIAFTSAIAGCLLLVSWLQHRETSALAYWGASFLMMALSTALFAERGVISDLWSIVAANGILALGHGLLWSGTRSFEGRPISVIGTIAGVLIWLAACTLDGVYTHPWARASVMTAILSAYLLLAAYELWSARGESLTSRWPIIGLLVAHAVLMPLRIPLAGTLGAHQPSHVELFAFVAFEAIFISICVAYLLGSVVSERTVQHFKRASLSDPLTGLANRRAFLDEAPRVIRRARYARQPVSLLLFDLDRFKQINDAFGHQAGDQVLASFSRIATSLLRPGDLFARIGGEEFACLLSNTPQQGALSLAERVRGACEAATHDFPKPFAATVSVGVATMRSAAGNVDTLLAAADRALYRAKAQGRNRVEPADDAPAATLVWRMDADVA
jgi:diguanylate cyclase (GGDEF)-like protein